MSTDRISFIDALRWLAGARDDELLITLVVNPHRPYRDGPRVRKRQPRASQVISESRRYGLT
jgi:hypothetical protein